ncbi:unnamed protein product [Clonostachys solani]|uniref:Uncharacterized protein n=1 Tax=Clonostachys solani TaxID=160281 RepID=A0A9N9Z996_9HYPO|nr:unnamed protein product [Clonostachys solani]
MESPYSSDPPNYEKWPCPESLPDLASVYEELGRLETLEQAANRHLRDAEGQEGAHPHSGDASLRKDEPSLTQQDGWRDVAQRLKQQQAGLESRAAYLSSRPINACLNLSTEILLMIIKCFEYTPNSEDTGRQGIIAEFPEENLRTIQALRLTCRHLNLLASPFLLPVVKLSVNNMSLALANSLCFRPHMAAGVHAIRIGLGNRPADSVTNMYPFLELKEPDFESLAVDLRTEVGQATLLLGQAHQRGEVETIQRLEIATNNMYDANCRGEMIRSAMTKLKKELSDAWNGRRHWRLQRERRRRVDAGLDIDSDVDPFMVLAAEEDFDSDVDPPVPTDVDPPVLTDVDPVNMDHLSRYRRLVTDAHKEYGRIQREQLELLQTGIFANTVARLASQGRHPISLEFFESRRYRPGNDPSTTRTPYRSVEALFDFLLAAPAWGNLADPVSLNVLLDLPIAIRNTGRILNGFQLSVPPMLHQIPSIYSDDQPNNAWHGLSAASQTFKFFNLEKKELKRIETGDETIAAAGLRGIRKYFTALLSGHCFEEVSFDGYAYKRQGLATFGRQLPIGQAFANIEWPQIKTVRIFHVSMTQAELEGFVRGLGSNLEEIILHDVEMTGESSCWMRALDILKEKVARRPEGALGFHVPYIIGDDITMFVQSSDKLLVEHFERSKKYTAMKLIERYVNNDGISELPLRDHVGLLHFDFDTFPMW